MAAIIVIIEVFEKATKIADGKILSLEGGYSYMQDRYMEFTL
jgi:hypothetical protein